MTEPTAVTAAGTEPQVVPGPPRRTSRTRTGRFLQVVGRGFATVWANPKARVGLVMLGAFIGATEMFDADTLVEALRHKLGPAKEKLIPLNRQAIETGIAAGRG